MKTAGEIISGLFDKQFTEKARGYSKFFDSWTDITEKNGIGNSAAYSRIKDLDKGIVLIEVDHPGWKQILQTKQGKLLYDFRYRFPTLNITGISLMLSRGEQKEETHTKAQRHKEALQPVSYSAEQSYVTEESNIKSLNAIKDEDFKEKLRQLGKMVEANEHKYFN